MADLTIKLSISRLHYGMAIGLLRLLKVAAPLIGYERAFRWGSALAPALILRGIRANGKPVHYSSKTEDVPTPGPTVGG